MGIGVNQKESLRLFVSGLSLFVSDLPISVRGVRPSAQKPCNLFDCRVFLYLLINRSWQSHLAGQHIL
jgi:hypothetical protein